MSTEAEVEAAARAIAEQSGVSRELFDRSHHSHTATYRKDAAAALAAVEPLIRERLAQRVEAEQEDATDRAMNYALSGDSTSHALALLRAETFGVAVSIIRGDS